VPSAVERPNRLMTVLRAACAGLALALSTQAMAQDVERRDDARQTAISEKDIDAAIAKVNADPKLSSERKTRTLRWAGKDRDTSREPPGWLAWLKDLFAFLAQNGRFLFWGVLALLAAMLLIYLSRLFTGWRMPERPRRLEVPSFVRDLDIRPESLPDDIGAAARQLWDGGDHRAALSLLYRGLLSRLAHVHGVPIKDSTTEGDCLALAAQHLFDESRKTYVVQLVRLWQRAVYGGERVADESVHALCEGFARALDDPGSAPSHGGRPAAGVAS
jgi:hypothetical protein